jgi:hypothetical protein
MSDLARIKLKVERAKHHARELECAIQTFRDSDPYGFRIEDDLQTGDKVHRIHIRRETPDCFALLIGDAVHNLRTALDHLAWQLVVANGQTPKSGAGGTQFPFYDPKSGAKPTHGVINGISATAQKLIDAVKPYKGGNDALWTLHQLDITDKHKLLIVTAFALSEIMPTWYAGVGGYDYLRMIVRDLTPKNGIVDMLLNAPGVHPQDFRICVPIGNQGGGILPVLQDNTIVSRIIAPVHREARFDMSFEIAVCEPQITSGRSIIPLLTDLANVVESFIDQFGIAGILK